MKRAALFAIAGLLMAQAAAPAGEFTIGGAPFTQAEILDARAVPELDGPASILITLDAKAAQRLAGISRKLAGQAMPVRLDGEEIAAPRLAGPIEGGVLTISGAFSVPQAEALAKRISGKDPVPEEFAE